MKRYLLSAAAVLTMVSNAEADDLTYSNYVLYTMDSAVVCALPGSLTTAYSLWAAGEKEMLQNELCLVLPQGFKVRKLDEIGSEYVKVLVEAGGTKMMMWGKNYVFKNAMYRAVEEKCGSFSLDKKYDACRNPIVDAYKLVPGGDN